MPISTVWILQYVQQCYVKWFWTISSLGAPVLSQIISACSISSEIHHLHLKFAFFLWLFFNCGWTFGESNNHKSFQIGWISEAKRLVANSAKWGEMLDVNEALLGVNSDKRHGLEPATWEPRSGDDRQTIATNYRKRHQCQDCPTANLRIDRIVNVLQNICAYTIR